MDGKAKMPAHLIDADGVKMCSVCNKIFDKDSVPSLSSAFLEHVITKHIPSKAKLLTLSKSA